MAAYKRTDPGKLARDREAIRKSQEEMNHPTHPAFEAIGRVFQNIDRAIKQKVAKNAENAALQRDYGAPFGSRPLRTGAEEQTKVNPMTTIGGAVVGRKKSRSIA